MSLIYWLDEKLSVRNGSVAYDFETRDFGFGVEESTSHYVVTTKTELLFNGESQPQEEELLFFFIQPAFKPKRRSVV